MTGYTQVNLKRLLGIIDEKAILDILSGFSCPLNEDVESFLTHSAIPFARQGIAASYE